MHAEVGREKKRSDPQHFFFPLFVLSVIQVNVKERKRKEAAGHRPNVHAEAWAKAPRKMMQLGERRKRIRSTRPSLVVPHRGTTRARSCLTSEFRWDPVTQDDMAADTWNPCFSVSVHNA